MKTLARLFVLLVAMTALPAAAERITIAAAADLKFALTEIVTQFKAARPNDEVEMIFGSSGKFRTQIANGAPFDLFFSADIAYPRELKQEGLAASEVIPYAVGRIVLWSQRPDAAKLTLNDLTRSDIRKIAIANPRHAPYGMRAQEALQATGLWDKLQPKLVYGENVGHTAQFVESGAADVGIIALSLVLNPGLKNPGGYYLVPADLHQPLQQGFIITQRAQGNKLARAFADYMGTAPARKIMRNYGFVLPGE